MKKEIRKELRIIQEKDRLLKLRIHTKSVYVSKKNQKNRTVDETLEKPVSESSHESFKHQQQMSMIDLTGVEVCEEVKEVKIAEQHDKFHHESSAGGEDNEDKEDGG